MKGAKRKRRWEGRKGRGAEGETLSLLGLIEAAGEERCTDLEGVEGWESLW